MEKQVDQGIHSDGNRNYTRVSEIWMDQEGIMHILFFKGFELSLADMEEAHRLFGELGYGPGKNKSRQLLTGGPFTISKEAREYAGKNGKDYFYAAAMVSNSFLMRSVITIFNALQKHDVPFRIFASEAEAIGWLKTYPRK
ncbi:MAG TPA: hypothetical protein VI731_00880 [Bacteroidia bacterium]|nr:hypothetical protein [Bacteroidia bacterium]